MSIGVHTPLSLVVGLRIMRWLLRSGWVVRPNLKGTVNPSDLLYLLNWCTNNTPMYLSDLITTNNTLFPYCF